ncbi:L-glutamine ABC transporter membrane protein /L-glutamate ABC transporter membrane protein /L-aspartate ABC transporter membrane protein /L-asparagine ABC transporter membrane protein [Pacificibacter maritimus]|uniref:L-glutamine ABC transporter membrane protein /L-glutamate ABC transporter membrane protein /L-aspartate ABC transporter membrane protein /L-asparagine ABC transporter membrane protein n=1 Tax=Pacificibacter maritimus TaxID=762213 RepID=A0A3N4U8L4_9RHOB|nr:amino acid ABC transporter permease [Pacificibacter maritimus]RPE63309.1 L-glutamine ABC transporter membrane protein /L-glutamate ABC transporter membrane protein /L-aspartate ABC transporter membrane protein /L-asparagine ABC transporter membrane protein [Pacificibacter maritimus]
MKNSKSVAFVREGMIDQQPAPASQIGAVRWLKDNLFSSVLNSILTIISLLVIFWVLSGIVPWMFGGVWNASSLSECRDILNERYGNTHYACWAVLTERWQQLLFGFYPAEEIWRAVVAFVLMLVAIAPVLFESVPRKLLWVTIAFPFLMVWLVWGGPIWGPLLVALGFVLFYVSYVVLERKSSTLLALIGSLVIGLVWWMFCVGPLSEALGSALPIGDLERVESRVLGGFMICVIIGLSGIALSLPIGLILALGRQSNLWVVKAICVGFIEFIRGVPLITLLFTASLLLNYFLPPGTAFDLTLRVIIMVTLFSSAYMAEVIRGGLAALPKGQYEAADALGLDYWQSQRLIIMPQALKISIPGIVNTFIGLFKDTTLVMFIGIFDMLGLSNAIRANSAWNGINWELYIFIGLVFWICCFSMSQYSQWLERKLRTGHH